MSRHAPPPHRAIIEAAAARARAFLEPRWTEWRERNAPWRDGPASSGMCRFSAIFLARVLADETGIRWTVRGGSPVADAGPFQLRCEGGQERDGGMLDAEGKWRGHYWVEDLAGNMIVDVTADQFGHPPHIVSAPGDGRYSGNYLARAILEHLSDASVTPKAWMRAWRAECPSPAAAASR